MASLNGVLLVSGSVRTGSYNQRLLDIAERVSGAMAIPVTRISLRDYPLPIYDLEAESGSFPGAAHSLKAEFQRHTAILIASPEHNASVSVLLKNAIDWISRPTGDEPPLALSAFRGKAFGLMSASPGPFGGLRGLTHLRQILTALQGVVVPEQLAIPSAHSAFDADGLTDPLATTIHEMVVEATTRMATRLII